MASFRFSFMISICKLLFGKPAEIVHNEAMQEEVGKLVFAAAHCSGM